jgi:N-acetylmuramoyl-L-alanine amidase
VRREKMILRLTGLIVALGILMNTLPVHGDSYVMHTVKMGETYSTIGKQYNKSEEEIRKLNGYSKKIYTGNLVKINPIKGNKSIGINVNGKLLQVDSEPYMEKSRVFVPVSFIAKALNVNEIKWDKESESAIIKDNNKEIILPIKSDKVVINGKEVKLDAPININDGRTFVPIRFVAQALDCEVGWNAKEYIVNIKKEEELIEKVQKNYGEEDLYWLSRIVEAEAKGEPFEGKLGVANVIINRRKHPQFPGTIKDVIFDNKWGYQYTPVVNGTIYNNPSEDSIRAAIMALGGNNNIGDCLYFLNPRKITNFWVVKNRKYYTTIEEHDFYL